MGFQLKRQVFKIIVQAGRSNEVAKQQLLLLFTPSKLAVGIIHILTIIMFVIGLSVPTAQKCAQS